MNKRQLKKNIKKDKLNSGKNDLPVSTFYQVSGKRDESGILNCFEVRMVPMFGLKRFYGGADVKNKGCDSVSLY
ncbi:hypothetical protein [Lacrimispora sphenoides]|uniref:Uncharacterized protein n=1 Tax=Lacrimispora sphenoides JCM 1415 TaxID=1297793 RepID=A0ABY1C4R2_9FIRM|nr:hypothetical protein [Lacrimispora sphenoides]SET65309.1 hypothetical protein SAMN02745906_0905 [[Clostridium] sphenoides JCM 1415]SUY50284.1 Uncharacterised protein [Lacrimispora sphenoides]